MISFVAVTGGSAVFMSRVPTVHELKEKSVLPGPGEYDGANCSDLKSLMEPVEHGLITPKMS